MKTTYFCSPFYTVEVSIEVEVETNHGRVVGAKVVRAAADGDLVPPFDGAEWIGPNTDRGILAEEMDAAHDAGNPRKERRLEEKADAIHAAIREALDSANWGNPSIIDVP